jgi:hypothetical protein
VPIRVGGDGISQGATFAHALQIIDGDPTAFTVVSRATSTTDVEFVYLLPALTTFDRFAVPNVAETPSPSQTFFQRVEVHGSATGPDDDYDLLAEGTLKTHARVDEVTELEIKATRPVRWVRVRLSGGIQMMRPPMFLEFGEIIGNGTQEQPAMAETFNGAWRGLGVRLTLRQDGPIVSGCYDRTGDLSGTVSGNILRATGTDRTNAVRSAFILSITPDGSVRGVSSSNGGPFRLYEAATTTGDAGACGEPPAPVLGCGAIVHGIQFAHDSAEIRSDSDAVLEHLYKGLRQATASTILIEGHTSNEGAGSYNQQLSERRAAAVRSDLMRRGFPGARLRVSGLGETRPIADNDDESGRSMNRRVEILCPSSVSPEPPS